MTKFVKTNFVMFGSTLKELRTAQGMVLREVAALTGIDQGVLSKLEGGGRKASEKQLAALAGAYDTSYISLRKEWLVDQITSLLQYENEALEVLEVCEQRMAYLNSSFVHDHPSISSALQEQLAHIDELKAQWQAQRPSNALQVQRMQEYFHLSYTYESNRIEGNTLSLQETKMVVEEGLTIGGKSVVEHLEAINHSAAVAYIASLEKEGAVLDRRAIMDLHRLVLKGIDTEHAGVLRKVPVRISGSAHEPPQPYLLSKLMEDYYIFYASNRGRLHPVVLAAEMHERLVTIHPFIDGNGRTSRLVMNLILLQNGYTIANLKGDLDSRMHYYKALQAVQVDGDPTPFYELVVGAVKQSLVEHLELT